MIKSSRCEKDNKEKENIIKWRQPDSNQQLLSSLKKFQTFRQTCQIHRTDNFCLNVKKLLAQNKYDI